MKRKVFLCFALMLLLLGGLVRAEGGEDITKRCKFEMAGSSKHRAQMFDRMYKTAWQIRPKATSNIKITLPKDVEEGGLYLCWAERPEEWKLYLGETLIAQSDDNDFYHEYVPFAGSGKLRLEIKAKEKKRAMMGELFVIEGDTPPAFVQRWEKTPEQADIMILVAHPDDDLLFMGGAIPYYTHVEKKPLIVSYLTCANHMRRSEMLNALWKMGVRHYPVIGSFQDKAFKTRALLYNSWRKERAQGYVTELFRKYKPQVVLSHDINGEYGHSAHKVAAELAQYAAKASGNENLHKESAKKYGVHSIDKLYLHLYKNQIRLDWKKSYEELGGKSPLEVAEEGFKMHRSQQKNHRMGKSAVYDTEKFGLAFSNVGDDVEKNNFFENVVPREQSAEQKGRQEGEAHAPAKKKEVPSDEKTENKVIRRK